MKQADVIVVGAGIAGLTAAAYARKFGKSVILIDKNSRTGGLLQSFTHQGYTFDAGARALIDGGILSPMFKELGIELNWVPNEVSLRFEDQSFDVTDPESINAYAKILESLFPDSKNDIVAIIKHIKKIMKDMDVLYGIENPLFREPLKEPGYLFGTLIPWSFKFLGTIGRIYQQQEPFEQTLRALTKNRSLADLIGQHFFKQTPSFFALSYFSLFLDYQYPLGGTGMLAQNLEECNHRLRTKLILDTRITKLDTNKKVLEDFKGQSYRYGKLIWAADPELLSKELASIPNSSKKQQARISKLQESFNNRKGGDSVITLFLGSNLPPSYFKKISKGHFFFTPSRQGLGDIHTKELEKLIQLIEEHQTQIENKSDNSDATIQSGNASKSTITYAIQNWLERCIRFNTLEISIPVLRDPNMAPKGKTGLIVSILFDYKLTKQIEVLGWYAEFKTLFQEMLVQTLEETVYPGLSQSIEYFLVSTPLSLEKESGSFQGAITGWTFEKGIPPVEHQIHRSTKAVLTPFKDIYQAGQWTYSPSGVPISVLTGKIAALKTKH
jgi:phytoene dehydrogenase-like protein